MSRGVRMKNMWTLLHGTSHRPSSGSRRVRPISPTSRDANPLATVTSRATKDPSAARTTTVRGRFRPTPVPLMEGLRDMENQLDGRRPEQDHEEYRKDATHHGEEHLQAGLLGLGLRLLTAAAAHLVGLDAQHPGDAHAQLIGLHQRLDEGGEFLDS